MTERTLVPRTAAIALVVVILTGLAGAVCSACSAGSNASAAPSDSPRGQPGDVRFSQTLLPFSEPGAGGIGYRIDATPSGHAVVACSVRGYHSAATVSLSASGIDWQFQRDCSQEDATDLNWSDQALAPDGLAVDVGVRADHEGPGYSLVVSRFVDAETRFDTTYQEADQSLRGTAVAVGPDGAIYVVGVREDTSDIVLIKYDPTLKAQWVRYFGGPAYEWGRAVTVQGDSVYVAGEGYRRGRSLDLLVMRFDAQTGRRLWARYVTTGDRREQQLDALLARPTGIYVCGHVVSTEHPTPIAVLAKVAPSGVQRWVRSSPGVWWADIAAAPDGSLRLTGSAHRCAAGFDMITAAFRRDGRRLWLRAYKRSFGTDLDVDASGATYVGGSTPAADPATGHDLLVAAYSASGERLWVTRQPGGNMGNLYYGVMDLDVSDDSVWVTGTSVDHQVLVLQLQK